MQPANRYLPVWGYIVLKPYYNTIISIRDALSLIDGIKTCKLGMEHTISAVDYPMIRIIPSLIKKDVSKPRRQSMDLIVYYGDILHEFEDNGLETQYKFFLEMDAVINSTIMYGNGWCAEWIDTTLDEDRLPGYKLFASRYTIT
jgi:hypothetical protein